MIVSTLVGAVLLLAAPCPGNPRVEGCVALNDRPPTVYILPNLGPMRWQWVWWHELGHIALDHTPGGVDDGNSLAGQLWADLYAACHVPWTRHWLAYRDRAGYTRNARAMHRTCRLWGEE